MQGPTRQQSVVLHVALHQCARHHGGAWCMTLCYSRTALTRYWPPFLTLGRSVTEKELSMRLFMLRSTSRHSTSTICLYLRASSALNAPPVLAPAGVDRKGKSAPEAPGPDRILGISGLRYFCWKPELFHIITALLRSTRVRMPEVKLAYVWVISLYRCGRPLYLIGASSNKNALPYRRHVA